MNVKSDFKVVPERMRMQEEGTGAELQAVRRDPSHEQQEEGTGVELQEG